MSAAVLGSYAQTSTSRRARCAVTASAVPHAPAPTMPTDWSAMPASPLSICQISCPSAKRENSSLNAGTERRRRIWIERPAGTSGRRKIVGKTARETLRACPGDHDCIVGAKRRRRHDEAEAVFLRDRFERGCKSLVSRDTACDDECALRLRAEALDIEFHGARRPVPDDVGDDLLEALARSAISLSLSGARARASCLSAVLRPAREKCGSVRPNMGRGRAMVGRPRAAQASTAGPPG